MQHHRPVATETPTMRQLCHPQQTSWPTANCRLKAVYRPLRREPKQTSVMLHLLHAHLLTIAQKKRSINDFMRGHHYRHPQQKKLWRC